jgi:hypothetical protein
MADNTQRASGQDKANSKQKRAYTWPALIVSTFAFVVGVALLALAIPRTVAAWTSLEVRPAMARLEAGEQPTAEELAQCIDAGERAIEWIPSSVRLANLGSCEFAQARQVSADSPERGDWLARAEEHTKQSLTYDPTDGFTWVRLGRIREMRGAAARDIMSTLMMSIEMTPNARPLWRLRSEMLLVYARLMTPDDSAALRRHLHTMWTYSPRHRPMLLEMAHRLGRLDILRGALADDPEAIAELAMMERQSRFP